jgi:hypothetical protein
MCARCYGITQLRTTPVKQLTACRRDRRGTGFAILTATSSSRVLRGGLNLTHHREALLASRPAFWFRIHEIHQFHNSRFLERILIR